jgi:hypothetical protein
MIWSGTSAPEGRSWQLVLADLALILFLVTLAALAASSPAGQASPPSPSQHFAPSQALFRPVPDGPSLSQWLARQPQDRRATLTIIARHTLDDAAESWERAARLAREGQAAGANVRVVITRGATSELYASLAYDAPQGET